MSMAWSNPATQSTVSHNDLDLKRLTSATELFKFVLLAARESRRFDRLVMVRYVAPRLLGTKDVGPRESQELSPADNPNVQVCMEEILVE